MIILRATPFHMPLVNGPTKEADLLTRELAKRDVVSNIITTNYKATEAPAEEQHKNWSIKRLPESFGFLAYRRVPGLNRFLNEPADLVYAHCYRNRLTAFAAEHARKNKIPLIVQPHGTLLMNRFILPAPLRFPYATYDFFRKRDEILNADAILVSVSQEKEEAIEFGVSAEKVHVIPYGCDAFDLAHRPPPGSQEKLRVLFVGRIAPDRRVEMIIQAVGQLAPEERSQIDVRVVGPIGLRSLIHSGDKYMQRLRELTVSLGVDDVITFPGPQYGQDLIEEYKAADLFLYTSDYENFGQTVLEAASYGCPILATPTGVAGDIVRDNETGYRIPFRNSDVLAEKMTTLIQNRSLLERFSRNIHNVAHSEYNWPHVIDRHLELYRSLH